MAAGLRHCGEGTVSRLHHALFVAFPLFLLRSPLPVPLLPNPPHLYSKLLLLLFFNHVLTITPLPPASHQRPHNFIARPLSILMLPLLAVLYDSFLFRLRWRHP